MLYHTFVLIVKKGQIEIEPCREFCSLYPNTSGFITEGHNGVHYAVQAACISISDLISAKLQLCVLIKAKQLMAEHGGI